ncbi:Phenylalanyl-tRNA synthetase [Aspergillus pseudodeflectus]|uniref:Phenylalanyl-tRNA synthetase n=1 Tax=Aspergillus pseudodeflectus TaxID=176178 RepID=A0ABR4JQ05_9EURO
MAARLTAQQLLEAASVSPEIFALRPDYRALLMVVEGLPSGPSDASSEAMLQEAENHVKELLSNSDVTNFPHIAAWRDTYKAFGAKPNKTRNSLEALTRRAESGLPRVNRLTDIYNAISVKHQIPLGGEDLDKYDGSPFLIRATGKEPFQTFSSGESAVESAVPGEPVWCDATGITCRRWNWRQGPRTALTNTTSRVLFILDALEPCSDEDLTRAANELSSVLQRLSSEIQISRRIVDASS